jgi:hypothetical protein
MPPQSLEADGGLRCSKFPNYTPEARVGRYRRLTGLGIVVRHQRSAVPLTFYALGVPAGALREATPTA